MWQGWFGFALFFFLVWGCTSLSPPPGTLFARRASLGHACKTGLLYYINKADPTEAVRMRRLYCTVSGCSGGF